MSSSGKRAQAAGLAGQRTTGSLALTSRGGRAARSCPAQAKGSVTRPPNQVCPATSAGFVARRRSGNVRALRMVRKLLLSDPTQCTCSRFCLCRPVTSSDSGTLAGAGSTLKLREALVIGGANKLARRMSRHNGYKTLGEHATLAQLHPSTARVAPDDDGLLPEWVVYNEMVATAKTFLSKVQDSSSRTILTTLHGQ